MENNWTPVKLGEVASVQSGFAFKSKDMGEIGAPIIKIKNINPPNVDVFDVQRVPHQIIQANNRISRFELSKGDILIAMTGATVGKVGRMPQSRETCYLNQRVGKVYLNDSSRCDYDFLYYVLSQEKNVKQMFGIADGSAQANISGTQIERIELPLPPLTEQKAIAHILGSLDDKIELNRRMNETLEAMAQALFKSWFVDFDPVIDNALAAGNEIPEELKERGDIREALGDARKPLPEEIQNLFSSEFEHSEEMGWIPKGWEVSQIGELLELAYGKALSAKNREPGPFPVYGSGGIGGYHKESLVKGAGIIVGRKGTVGSVFWEDDDFFPIDTVFFVKLLQDVPLYWIYQRLSLMNIAALGADSAVPGVNRNAVHAKRWVVPDSNVFKKYWDLFEVKVEKLRELKQQSRILSNLRDTLLPQLLSGEMRIPEAEKLVEGLERNGGGNGKS